MEKTTGGDYDALAKALLGMRRDPQSAALLERLGTILNTAEGRQLLALLSKNGSADTLRIAAEAALRGDRSRAVSTIASLLSTKEEAVLAAKLIAALGGGKGSANG